MAGLVPAIHVAAAHPAPPVERDARNKSGHDDGWGVAVRIEHPRARGFSTPRLRRSGRNDEVGGRRAVPRYAPCGGCSGRGFPFPSSRVAARRAPPSSFRPEPCAARRSGETSHPRARGFSTPRLRRSGRNDDVGGKAGRPSIRPLRGLLGMRVPFSSSRVAARRAPPRHFDRSRARHGAAEKPRACGAPVEMTRWGVAGASLDPPPAGAARDAGIFLILSSPGPGPGRIEGRSAAPPNASWPDSFRPSMWPPRIPRPLSSGMPGTSPGMTTGGVRR